MMAAFISMRAQMVNMSRMMKLLGTAEGERQKWGGRCTQDEHK
jgi:hypothetical protein